MFCEKCGRKLPAGAERCPACGESAEIAEYCGGFWGLTEGGAPAQAQPQPDERLIAQRDALRGQIAKRNKRERRLLGVIIALSILLILSAAMTLWLLLHPAQESETRRSEPTEETAPADETDAPRSLPDVFSNGSGANP